MRFLWTQICQPILTLLMVAVKMVITVVIVARFHSYWAMALATHRTGYMAEAWCRSNRPHISVSLRMQYLKVFFEYNICISIFEPPPPTAWTERYRDLKFCMVSPKGHRGDFWYDAPQPRYKYMFPPPPSPGIPLATVRSRLKGNLSKVASMTHNPPGIIQNLVSSSFHSGYGGNPVWKLY